MQRPLRCCLMPRLRRVGAAVHPPSCVRGRASLCCWHWLPGFARTRDRNAGPRGGSPSYPRAPDSTRRSRHVGREPSTPGIPEFGWTAVPGAVNYRVQFSQDVGFATFVEATTPNTRFTPTNASQFPDGTWWWR